MFTHYDRAHVAQLCEKAGLLQRVCRFSCVETAYIVMFYIHFEEFKILLYITMLKGVFILLSRHLNITQIFTTLKEQLYILIC